MEVVNGVQQGALPCQHPTTWVAALVHSCHAERSSSTTHQDAGAAAMNVVAWRHRDASPFARAVQQPLDANDVTVMQTMLCHLTALVVGCSTRERPCKR